MKVSCNLDYQIMKTSSNITIHSNSILNADIGPSQATTYQSKLISRGQYTTKLKTENAVTVAHLNYAILKVFT